ncbi:MAG: PAS domain S-box protein [Fimbriimonadia bacterium]|jgi:PAS domain S-box-containing protein
MSGSTGKSKAPAARDAEWLRQIVDENLAGIYRTSLDGRILYCNDSFARMLGYASSEEMKEVNAADLYPSERARNSFLKTLRTRGSLQNFELTLRRKDGQKVTVLENVSLVYDSGNEGEIIQGTSVDITALKAVESELRKSEEQHRSLAERLRDLAQHLQKVREEERTRIARELHDELGQALTALKLDLHWLAERTPDADLGTARIRSMLGLVDQTITSVRQLCSYLRPAILDDLGLGAAIGWIAQDVERRTGIRCRATMSGETPELPVHVATAAFRILQESLTNVVRHANATEVEIALSTRGGRLIMEVRDNGTGFSEGRRRTGVFGVAGMQERALELGGKLRVISRRGVGTRVRLTVPLAEGTAQ